MPTLVEIAEQESKIKGKVLFDLSICLDSFRGYTYKIKRYSELDAGILEGAEKSTEEFLEFLTKENTFTVEGVAKYFMRLHTHLNTQREYFDIHQKGTLSYATPTEKQNKKIFRNICTNISIALDLLRPKVFIPDDIDLYDKLNKKRSYLLYKIQTFQEKAPISVELYTSALYFHLHRRIPISIVVKGAGRGKIFNRGIDLLVEAFKREEPEIFPALEQSPIKLYVDKKGRGFNLVYTTQNEKPAQTIHT